jgi:hypothetical protein
MDNHSIHKDQAMVDALAYLGHSVLWLPTYSPFFNPIEHMFAKVKSCIATGALSYPFLNDLAIVQYAFSRITAADCLGYVSGCGYVF